MEQPKGEEFLVIGRRQTERERDPSSTTANNPKSASTWQDHTRLKKEQGGKGKEATSSPVKGVFPERQCFRVTY